MIRAYVAAGSNIEPQDHLPSALERLQACVTVCAVSDVAVTEPIARPDQASYRNGVWEILTEIPPRPLKFEILRGVEAAEGRIRTEDRYAARTLDLDLLLYGDEVIEEEGLVVPDPDLETRPFLALSLLALAPGLIHPALRIPLGELPAAQGEGLRIDLELSERLRAMIQKNTSDNWRTQ